MNEEGEKMSSVEPRFPFCYLEKKREIIYILELEKSLLILFKSELRGGGIGRRKGLKIPRRFAYVPVRVRPSALSLYLTPLKSAIYNK